MHGKPVFLNTENIYRIGDLAGVFHITQDATNIQSSYNNGSVYMVVSMKRLDWTRSILWWWLIVTILCMVGLFFASGTARS